MKLSGSGHLLGPRLRDEFEVWTCVWEAEKGACDGKGRKQWGLTQFRQELGNLEESQSTSQAPPQLPFNSTGNCAPVPEMVMRAQVITALCPTQDQAPEI